MEEYKLTISYKELVQLLRNGSCEVQEGMLYRYEYADGVLCGTGEVGDCVDRIEVKDE